MKDYIEERAVEIAEYVGDEIRRMPVGRPVIFMLLHIKSACGYDKIMIKLRYKYDKTKYKREGSL